MLRWVVTSGLDDARKLLLVNIIETYFELSDDEQRRFERLLSRKEFRTVQEVKETWLDRARAEGRQAGVIEGKREALLRQLSAKFGSLTPDTIAKVAAVPSAAELDAYLDRILTAESLEDVGLKD
jgi:hypothetical protein